MVGISGSRAAERAHIFRKRRIEDRGRREGGEGGKERGRKGKEERVRIKEGEKGTGSRRTKDNISI